MPRVLLRMLEVRVCKLEAVEGGFGLLEVPEVIRCALLCMLLEAVEGGLCSLEALEVQRCGGWVLFDGGAGDDGGDTLRATLYAAGSCGG